MKITCKTEYAEVTLDLTSTKDDLTRQLINASSYKENANEICRIIELCAAKCKEQSEAIYKLKTTF